MPSGTFKKIGYTSKNKKEVSIYFLKKKLYMVFNQLLHIYISTYQLVRLSSANKNAACNSAR